MTESRSPLQMPDPSDDLSAAGLALICDALETRRRAARLDIFKACAVLSLREDPTAEDYAEAFARTLEQALGRSPQVRSRTESRSFDEMWLLRLIERSLAYDAESVAFLISSRVEGRKRESVAFLVNGLAASLEAA